MRADWSTAGLAGATGAVTWDVSHLNSSLLDISGLCVSLRTSLVGDSDKGSSAVNIVVFSLDISSIPGLLMGHVGLGLIIGNLISILISSILRELSVVLKLLLLGEPGATSNSST